MSILFQQYKDKLGLGVGLDMQWGISNGFEYDTNLKSWDVATATKNFFSKYNKNFSYGFASLQPMPGCGMESSYYIPELGKYYRLLSSDSVRSLHHTFLNLGSLESYDKTKLFEFTNKVCDELNIQWINEDVGIWSINGKSLPYPLPPVLTKSGLIQTVKNVIEANKNLNTPLLLEFPGFTDGIGFALGKEHAFDYFYELVHATQTAMTLDTGHVLGYLWQKGVRGDQLYRDVERLPLEMVFEIHMSGCGIIKDRFHDFHHGVLLEEQVTLLKLLVERCPNLKGITYEDPKFKEDGRLIEKGEDSLSAIKSIVCDWFQDDQANSDLLLNRGISSFIC
jgi:uncharacterized protein